MRKDKPSKTAYKVAINIVTTDGKMIVNNHFTNDLTSVSIIVFLIVEDNCIS